eukprot:Seg1629.5 transcript_id=Seg1629.5/GoldUCD/mRNA.D3Y31 product="hypothetical protein" protein_id=Seg1629.5/GoldUCD/D3Y31
MFGVTNQRELDDAISRRADILISGTLEVVNRLSQNNLNFVSNEVHAAKAMAKVFEEESSLFEDFMHIVTEVIRLSYSSVVKNEKESFDGKLVAVEKAFLEARLKFQHEKRMLELATKCNVPLSQIQIIFQHVLQHVWSICTSSDDNHVPKKVVSSSFAKHDELGDDAILWHAGWVLKRVREDIKKGPEYINMKKTNIVMNSLPSTNQIFWP